MATDNMNDIKVLLAQQLIAVHTALDFNKEISLRLFKASRQEDSRGHALRPTPERPKSGLCCQVDTPTWTYVDAPEMDGPLNHLVQPLLPPRGQKDDARKKSSEGASKSNGRKDDPKSSKQQAEERVNHFFPRVEELKNTVSESLRRHQYVVEDLYKETGCFAAVARHDYFKYSALLVIAVNTVWIAFETDYNKADILCNAPMIFQIFDNAFCTFFTLEIMVRFMAFANKCQAFKDGWFLFDFSLVCLMAWETWALVLLYKVFNLRAGQQASGAVLLRMFRLVRLIRVARAGRLLTFAPELMTLVKGIVSAVRSVTAVLVLLLLVVYVFAIIFTQLLSELEVGAGYFEHVGMSLNTLLLQVLCGPDGDFINKLLAAHWAYYVLDLVFLLIALLTIMNMLIGILCGVVADVSEADKEEAFVAEVERQIQGIAKMIDLDGSGKIDKNEFAQIINDPELTQRFQELGVDIVGAADFAHFIFDEVEELSFVDFTHLVCQFRGAKSASIKDIMDMRKFVSMELATLDEKIGKGHDQLEFLQSQLRLPTTGPARSGRN